MSVSSAIAAKLTNYDDPRSLGSRLRRRRVGLLLRVIEHALAARETVTILDLGGTSTYWKILPESMLASGRLAITMVNTKTSARDLAVGMPFTHLQGDACALPGLADNAYDIVHSNSVIEHVGSWQRMKAFAGEVARLAPSHYVQTPNFWFPVEPHFVAPIFHWLPVPSRAWVLTRVGLGTYERARDIDRACLAAEGINLIGNRQFRYLFPDSQIHKERFLGLAKSLIAIRLGHRARVG